MTETKKQLNTIIEKLDKLISLQQIGIRKELEDLKKELGKDAISLKILELADGTLSSNDLKKKVIELTNTSERTVKRRLADLVEKGLLQQNREGQNIFYVNSGIIEA